MGKVIEFTKNMADSMVSFVTGLGLQGKDKAASTSYILPLWSDEELSVMYRASWIAKKIVNIPAFDATRKWRNWDAGADQITLLEEEEKRLNVRRLVLKALKRARLFGWSAIYISTGETNLLAPLDPARVGRGQIRFLNLMSKRQLTPGEVDNDPESPTFGEPSYFEFANMPGVRVHPSRLVIFKGEELPDDEMAIGQQKMGWGDSVLISTVSAIKAVDATAANIASLIFEAKVDVVKIPNLMDYLASPELEQRLLKRFNLANVAKGNNSTLILDAEEEYQQKSASFATLPDILQQFMVIVAGAADIPATRFLSQSPSGMNSTGESDIRNYYDHVASVQTLEIDPAMALFNECLIRSALGSRPPEIFHTWASLWQVSDKEKAEIGKMNVDSISTLHNTGLFPPEALANSAANMFIESGFLPGLEQDIEEAGGMVDFELEAQNQLALEQQKIAAAANNNAQSRRAVNDGPPPPRSLYVRRDVVNLSAIRTHYERQGLEVTVKKPHVTIIHSVTPVDWFKTGEPWQSELTLPAGGARVHAKFGPPGMEDTLVLMIQASELKWRHESFKASGAESSYDEFHPHISLRYKDNRDISEFANIEPYQGEIKLGPEIYEEVKQPSSED